MAFFTRRREPASPSPQQALSTLEQQVALNEQKAAQIQTKIAGLRGQAKAAVTRGERPRAAGFLRQAKMYEQQLQTLEQMNSNLQQQQLQLQMAHMQALNVQTLASTVRAQKQLQLQANVTPDTVADLQDDLAELQLAQQEINSILTQPVDSMDVDGLDAELAQMEADMAADRLDEVAPVPQRALPAVQPVQQVEDDELEALMA